MAMGVKGRCGAWTIHLLVLAGPGYADGDLRLVDAVQKKDTATARSLLNGTPPRERVDVNAAQNDGATALHWAAHWDDVEMAELLIRAGADVNTANDYGVTALALACTNRNSALVQKLLEARANPNAAQTTGVTPLMECARTGSIAAVRSLLTRGASVHATHARTGQTALMWAAAGTHTDIVKLLIEHGAQARPAAARAIRGRVELRFAEDFAPIQIGRASCRERVSSVV